MGKIIILLFMFSSFIKVNAIEVYDIHLNIPEDTTISIYDLSQFQYSIDEQYDIAATLESYIILNNQSILRQTTNNIINDLMKGEYLLTFTNDNYHIESIYLNLDHDIDVFPKTIEKQGQTYDLYINKQWVGKKIDEVTISLYENNQFIDSFILSKDNQYTYCIKNLNDYNHYVIVEENIEGYHYFINQEQDCYKITNVEDTYIEKLPQTGIPIFYIPYLLLIGLLCLLLSFI